VTADPRGQGSQSRKTSAAEDRKLLHDITVRVGSDVVDKVKDKDPFVTKGHIGTHFDVMDKEFPLEYTIREGIVFDVRGYQGDEIASSDVDLSLVNEGMFVGLCTGFAEEAGYGTKRYYSEQPVVSEELIDRLLEKKTAIIGIDFAGLRKGPEHTPKDQYCADRGAFVVENLTGLAAVCNKKLTVYTFPVLIDGLTGLPCRVVAESED
jgi:kynurenine formamidase